MSPKVVVGPNGFDINLSRLALAYVRFREVQFACNGVTRVRLSASSMFLDLLMSFDSWSHPFSGLWKTVSRPCYSTRTTRTGRMRRMRRMRRLLR